MATLPVALFVADDPANGWIVSTALLIFLIPLATKLPLRGRINDAIGAKLSSVQRAFLQNVRPPPLDHPALVCYVSGDEAQRWLQVVRSASRVAFRADEYVQQFVDTWPLLILLGVIAVGVDWLIGERGGFVTEGLLPSLAVMMAGLLAVVVMALLIPLASVIIRGHAAGFGWEGLLGFSVVDISTAREPELAPGCSGWGIEWTRAQSGHALRHSSFYADRRLPAIIAGWIRTRTAQAHRLTSKPAEEPEPQESRRNENTLLFRCILFVLVVSLLGVFWSYRQQSVAVEDLSADFNQAQVVSQEPICLSRLSLLPEKAVCTLPAQMLEAGEETIWTFTLPRPPLNQSCFLVGHYMADSREGHAFLGLERGPEKWGRLREVGCGFRVRMAATQGLGRCDVSFAKKVELTDDETARGCVVLKNHGKKTPASLGFELSWACMRK